MVREEVFQEFHLKPHCPTPELKNIFALSFSPKSLHKADDLFFPIRAKLAVFNSSHFIDFFLSNGKIQVVVHFKIKLQYTFFA